MKKNEIDEILKVCLEREEREYTIPTKEDWRRLEKRMDVTFPETFKLFIDFMSIYSFPGDVYNVLEKENNGNDTILEVYLYESKYPEWDKNMIPFYGIGNGDYFCICKLDMKIYYFYQENLSFDVYSQDMDEWIKGLIDFLE